MNTYILIITLFFISACSSDNDIKTFDIPNHVQLECIEHKSDVDLLMSAGIYTHKDKLIIFEPLKPIYSRCLI